MITLTEQSKQSAQSLESLNRSSLYQSMMPDDLVLEAFGKLNPSTAERAAYFFELWVDSKNNSFRVSTKERRKELDIYCRSIGLKHFWDYQIKGRQIRFVNETDLAMVKLGWNNND
jgi:hypothetical protein